MQIKINIDIISLFYNNEKIIKNYKKNIDNLKSHKYDFNFILIYNKSIDNTYEKLLELKNDYVKIINSFSNGCSLGKNIGIKNIREHTDYVLFLDSDFIIDISIIDEFLKNITSTIKYVSFYGGNIDNKKYIGGTFLDEDTTISDISEMKYLGGGCSMILYNIIKNNNLMFDEYYDPFIMQDVDFSFKVLKYVNIKKIKFNNKIKHLNSYTIKKFGNNFYKNQLIRNSIYIMNKYNILNKEILKDLDNFINLYFFNFLIKFFIDYNINTFENKGKTLLISNYTYLYFNDIDFYFEDLKNLNLLDFLVKNNITKIILDFSIFIKIYEQIKINNIIIEIILDLNNIQKNNFYLIKNISKIYTFFNIQQFILKIIFNNKIIVELVKYKKYNAENCFNILQYFFIII